MSKKKPNILFIDAYDSFSHNIISLLETTLAVTVRTIKIDNFLLSSDEELHDELKFYNAVICGPGPGKPTNQKDVGIIERIWKLSEENMLPVLGICLGFQSLCTAFEGVVDRLESPQHGIIRAVTHVGDFVDGKGSIFQGVGAIRATLYQSLHADIGHSSMSEDTFQKEKWSPTQQCPDLVPLAWAEWAGHSNDSGIQDRRILLAVRHTTKPFWALQYHPESICTNEKSHKVIENWFMAAEEWNNTFRMVDIKPIPENDLGVVAEPITRKSLLTQNEELSFKCRSRRVPLSEEEMALEEISTLHLDEVYHSQTITLPDGISAPDLLERLQDPRRDQIILDSSNSHETAIQVKGRYSIIAFDVDRALRFDYAGPNSEDPNHPILRAKFMSSLGEFKYSSLDPHPSGGIWALIAQFLQKRQTLNGHPESPFWGGFMGFTSYEMGLNGIDVNLKEKTSCLDLCLAWVTKSVVLDHEKGLIYIQCVSKRNSDGSMPEWITATAGRLRATFDPAVSPDISNDQPQPMLSFNEKVRHSARPSSCSCTCTKPSTSSGLFLPKTEKQIVMAARRVLPDVNPEMYDAALLAEIIQSWDFRTEAEKEMFRYSFPTYFEQYISNRALRKQQNVSKIQKPSPEGYQTKVRTCQRYIRDGESYELCLTGQTTVQRHRFDETWEQKTKRSSLADPDHDIPYIACACAKSVEGDSWSLYRKLRIQQPAPFASFIRLGQYTLISASPERFLKWDNNRRCELRPMKGTVRKSAAVSTLEQAKALLNVPKEQAENLMIVDLVRHDLHGICGSGNVSVPRLMVVEEYKSVFQMITVVEGSIPLQPKDNILGQDVSHTGLDVLVASLPPGSMTGAPKKRSCEILQEIEDTHRGLYSGVVGYMDIGGRGDWSVTIRSMWRCDTSDVLNGEEFTETWHIGAGGAVTSLSTPQGEDDEMRTKLRGTLGLFT